MSGFHVKNSPFNENNIPIIQIKGGLQIQEAIQNHPDLIPYLISKDPPRLDFEDRKALLLYNNYIAKDVYDLDLILEPELAIIPTPGLRYHFLLNVLKPDSSIIELGTGPSAIIALMAAKFFNATVLATEFDELYLRMAKQNIERNEFDHLISLFDSKGKILEGVIKPGTSVDYILSNPPYYEKILSPKVLWGGKEVELVSGEIGASFIVSMITEGQAFLKDDGIIAFLIPKKKTDLLNYILDFLNKQGCKFEILGLNAGTRVRYLFKVFKLT